MHKLLLSLFSLLFVFSLSAQEKRASPLMKASADLDGINISIQYGQPSKKDRDIFGSLVPYGKVWRTGANEASVIEFSEDVVINGTTVKAGKYALFTIPGKEEWTLILNSVWNQWGAYNYDSSKDVLKTQISSKSLGEVQEKFTISISKEGEVSISWDKTSAKFSIKKA
ncbi:MAG: DUF2911 domain-containing protein [Bacteroidetes bacterium]|nr:DUF2911 domain-containing protein [Bacteroidota bacterium]